MRLLYNILAILLVILAIPVFIVRLIREEGFDERLRQSFGFLPKDTLAKVAFRDCIWLHAASVGEIVATSPIVKEIRRELPGIPILISVVTASGYVMANRIIPEADAIIYFPLDIPWLSSGVVGRIKPRIFLLVETELWPNFLRAANHHNIPVMMVNGRISDKSVNRYRYLCGVLKDMLGTVVRFCMQSTIDAQYIIRLGADPRRVLVTGNTKFDQTYTDVTEEEKCRLLQQFGVVDGNPVLVAGSTHKGEEELLFSAFAKVREAIPMLKMVVAPRDTMRADELVNAAATHGVSAIRRTALPDKSGQRYDIIVLDTIGELGRVYSIGDVVYVGGSLIPHGGHNILEPAAHGKPILVGPHMFNFKDTYALLSGRGACDTVYDASELADKIQNILLNEQIRENMSRQAITVIQENRGAAAKSVANLKELLKTAIAS